MPNNIKVLNNLAYMLAEDNQELSKALDYSKRVLDAKPNDPGFLDTHAYVLYKNNKNKEAAEAIETALQQYSKQGHIMVPAVVYEHKGMIKESLGAKSEALTAYQQALETGADRLSQTAQERINKAIERVSQ
jgi:tetratricopeptide (TPR) repeat protein